MGTVSRKLLVLASTVVGAMTFLGPAYAEVWDFSTPITPAPSHTYVGTEGTPVEATGQPFAGGAFPNLVTSSVGTGVGLAPSGLITPGFWIALDISAIADVFKTGLSFQADSVTGTWQVLASNSATMFGGTQIGSCTVAPGNACTAVTTLSSVPAGDNFLQVTTPNGGLVLSELDAVPLPGAMLLFGTGLAGLGFVSRRRRSKKVSVLQAA